jgi:hypothetical protein
MVACGAMAPSDQDYTDGCRSESVTQLAGVYQMGDV